MNKKIILLFIFIISIAFKDGFSKILVICDAVNFEAIHIQVSQYLLDVQNIEHKNVEYITYDGIMGDNVEQCLDLRSKIERSYLDGLGANDLLEGVVLIGDLPVPLLCYPDVRHPGCHINTNGPNDNFYMDIWNTNTGLAYPNNGENVFKTAMNCDGCSVFLGKDAGHGAFYGDYNSSNGDNSLDIWVSRVYAKALTNLRNNSGYHISEYDIIGNYLDRVHERMTEPARVPSRGFAMGGPSDMGSLHEVLGQYMNNLKLPWLVEFSGGHNSSFNWMSQLQSGPCGNINWGAYNGVSFPNERNRRFCLYTELTDVSGKKPVTNDNAGWEWAGLYNHGSPRGVSFDAVGGADNLFTLNGSFRNGTLGPFWGGAYYRPSGGYLNYGYFYYNNDISGDPDPYQTTRWRGKSAMWRWKVPSSRSSSPTYDIFLHYNALSGNAENVLITYVRENCDADGNPTGNFLIKDTVTVHQNTHTANCIPGTDFEPIFRNVTINPNEMLIVNIDANSYFEYIPDPITHLLQRQEHFAVGDVIADAIMIRQYGNRDVIIDCNTPLKYTDVDNNPTAIFSTPGFYTSDAVCRGFEDMQDESTDHSAVSKTPFFLSHCCQTNWFTKNENLGNLFALGHNGLISMGAVTDNYTYDSYAAFTSALASGQDFGQSFLAQAGPASSKLMYALLGVGTLRSQPYIQYGSIVYDDQVFAAGTNISSSNPILLKNTTITANGGNVTVLSTASGSSPVCSHGAVVIRPETHIYTPSGSNTITIRGQ